MKFVSSLGEGENGWAGVRRPEWRDGVGWKRGNRTWSGLAITAGSNRSSATLTKSWNVEQYSCM